MAFPEYVPTRAVSIGGAAILESGESLSIRVRYTSSKSLVWNATGFRFEKYGREVKSELGSEITIALPRTDVQGWRDPELNAIIDVSAEGSYTHKYTAEVEYVDERGRVVGRIPRLGPFTVPAGDGVLDLDTYVPASSVAGEFVSIPDSWGRVVAEAGLVAEGAALSAAAAMQAAEDIAQVIPNTSAAVAAAVTEDGPAKEAVNATIAAAMRQSPSGSPFFRDVELWTFGHSFLGENPGAVSSVDKYYARVLAADLGMTYPTAVDGTNLKRAVNGSRAEEAVGRIVGSSPFPNGRRGVALVQCLLNSLGYHGVTTAALNSARDSMRTIVAVLSASRRIETTDATVFVAESGTWAGAANATSSGGSHRATSAQGASVDIALPSRDGATGVHHLLTYGKNTAPGGGPTLEVFDVTAGKWLYDIDLSGQVTAGDMPAVVNVAIPLSAPDGHTIRVTKTDSGASTLIIDALLVPDPAPIPVVAMKEPYLADYSASTSFPHRSDAAIDAFNALWDEIGAQYSNVIVADPNAGYWNKTTDIASDKVHPNDLGNAHLAACARDALLGYAYQSALRLGRAAVTGIDNEIVWNWATDPSMIVRYDAQTLSGLAAGAEVDTWAPSAGVQSAASLAQTTAGRRPVMSPANSIGTRRAVVFDGVDDFLASSAFSAGYDSPVTVICVWRLTSAGSGGSFVYAGNTTAGLLALQENAGGTAVSMVARGAADSVSTPNAPGSAWHVSAAVYNGATSTLYLDRKSPSASGAVSAAATAALLDVRLGAGQAGSANTFLSGAVAEFIAFDGALPQSKIGQVLQSLADKYGLTLAS